MDIQETKKQQPILTTLREFILKLTDEKGRKHTIQFAYDLARNTPKFSISASIDGSPMSSSKKTLAIVYKVVPTLGILHIASSITTMTIPSHVDLAHDVIKTLRMLVTDGVTLGKRTYKASLAGTIKQLNYDVYYKRDIDLIRLNKIANAKLR